jgi:hypothetical protein
MKCTSEIAVLLLISIMVSVSLEVSAPPAQFALHGVVTACFSDGNQNRYNWLALRMDQ